MLMVDSAYIKRDKLLDAVRGFRGLEMADCAIRELDAIADLEKFQF